MTRELFQAIDDAESLLTGIGQPLNDNVLRFNKQQIKWAFRMKYALENIREKADRRKP
jgi:hypothetical protein